AAGSSSDETAPPPGDSDLAPPSDATSALGAPGEYQFVSFLDNEEAAADADPATAEEDAPPAEAPAASEPADNPAPPAEEPAETPPTEPATEPAAPTEPAPTTEAAPEPSEPAPTTEPAPEPTTPAPTTEPAPEPPAESTEPPVETTEPAVVPAGLFGKTAVSLKLGHPESPATVRSMIRVTATELFGDIDLPRIVLSNPEWGGSADQRFDSWNAEIPLNEKATKQLLDALETKWNDSPVWLAANKIGGQVAGDMRETAIEALLASILGIVGYLWFRFQRVVFGLAAVIAVVHDVLVTLGALAASLWLSRVFGFLLVDEFKISLPVVAALLTIIGYSLNDTIVIFDRIREIRGKNPDLTTKMVNDSINQTLSRTLLTTITTLIVVVILYFLGGQSVRAFSFCLLVGIIAGTYSTVFIASPCLLWMMGTSKSKPAKTDKSKAMA
ncbi:MAG: protein translocase subunit SecF, partial [Planctomycetales bacterium]|nr:protein translocase subunit SecF [Planctomycetales bacterium]